MYRPGQTVRVREAEKHPDGVTGPYTIMRVSSDGRDFLLQQGVNNPIDDTEYHCVWVNLIRIAGLW